MGLLSRCTPNSLPPSVTPGERDFLAFVALMFRARTGMTFRVNRHHEQIVDALMSVYRGTCETCSSTRRRGVPKPSWRSLHSWRGALP